MDTFNRPLKPRQPLSYKKRKSIKEKKAFCKFQSQCESVQYQRVEETRTLILLCKETGQHCNCNNCLKNTKTMSTDNEISRI